MAANVLFGIGEVAALHPETWILAGAYGFYKSLNYAVGTASPSELEESRQAFYRTFVAPKTAAPIPTVRPLTAPDEIEQTPKRLRRGGIRPETTVSPVKTELPLILDADWNAHRVYSVDYAPGWGGITLGNAAPRRRRRGRTGRRRRFRG